MSKINYPKLAREVLEEQNKIRVNPSSFIPYIEEQIKLFKNDVLSLPGETPLQTNEGAAAWKEAITFLKKQKPLGKLEWNDGLSKSAQDHVTDIGPKGMDGHDGSDGSTTEERIERYSKW